MYTGCFLCQYRYLELMKKKCTKTTTYKKKGWPYKGDNNFLI